jgi:ABC-type lipoprotein release transport system permease subunit
MTQESPKSNIVLIIIAIIGVVGTITASVIGGISNYNIERLRQQSELTNCSFAKIMR